MSDALVCEDKNLERKVVVKSLKDGTDPKRLLDELSALLEIRSKHVVQIYDVIAGNKGEIAAIVEEYLPGSDLTSTKPPKTSDDGLRLLYPIAEGIADIHSHKRIHRDIKPNNMKYDAENCLKIFDFGLARIDGVDASTIALAGTPGFMAPELFVEGGDGKIQFTPAIDVFAFGATALCLFAGGLPKALKKMPPTLGVPELNFSSLPLGLPPDVASLLSLSLSADPSSRPAMAAIRDVVASHLLKGKHRALLVSGNSQYEISAAKPSANIASKGRGGIIINYDGFHFVITSVTGDVYINNVSAAGGMKLPGACVIVLGPPHMGSKRVFITMDVSHPEVTL